MSVVRRRPSFVVNNYFVHTLEVTVLWNLGQVWYWVTWGKKLGHQVKSKEKLVNTLEVTVLTQSWWNLLRMFALVISRSSSKLDHLGSKTRSRARSAENLVNTLVVTFLKQSSWILLKCLSWWFLGQVRNWVTWHQKLGHRAKSAENLVNTLAVTFFKQSSWLLLKMFVLMISRSSSKLGHLESKTRSPGLISRKPC